MSRDKVLVVDDDRDIRESLVELLEDHGCAVMGAANGFEALAALMRSEGACLIFLDLSMPVMDGTRFREEQLKRDEFKDIPVVLISAFANLGNHPKGLEVDAYLQKPLDAADVLDLARRYCPCSHGSA